MRTYAETTTLHIYIPYHFVPPVVIRASLFSSGSLFFFSTTTTSYCQGIVPIPSEYQNRSVIKRNIFLRVAGSSQSNNCFRVMIVSDFALATSRTRFATPRRSRCIVLDRALASGTDESRKRNYDLKRTPGNRRLTRRPRA